MSSPLLLFPLVASRGRADGGGLPFEKERRRRRHTVRRPFPSASKSGRAQRREASVGVGAL